MTWTANGSPFPWRSLKRGYDEEFYAERNEVERFLNRLKLNRRITTRYEETAQNYLSFIL